MLVRPAIRLRRWLAAIGLALVLTLGAAVVVLRVRFEGPDLADTLTEMMNKSMRGRIEVGSVNWPMSGIETVIRGGWIPLEFTDVKVYDDERQLVLQTPRLTAEIDIHALMFGRHDFVLRKIHVHGGRVLLREVAEPYQLHEYDKKVFSLLAAFYGVRKAGFYVGISASSGPVFDLRDYTISNVELEIWSGLKEGESKYSFRALVHDVNASGFLYMDPSDPLVPKFYFALAPTGGPGEIDILWEKDKSGEWKGFYRFPITKLAVNTLKQIPTTWPASPVANTLTFDVEIETVSQAKLRIKGAMIDYWDTPYGGSWQIAATVDNAGPMLKESILVDLGGDDVKVRAEITGSIVFYPRIDLSISGLTYDLKDFVPADPITGERRSVLLQLANLHAGYDLAVNAGNVDEFRARGVGGELKLSATFEGDGSNEAPFLTNAQIDITEPLELAPWIAPCQLSVLGDQTKLSGSFRARRYKGDTKIIAKLDDIDLRAGPASVRDDDPTDDRPGEIFADQSFGTVTVSNLTLHFRSVRVPLDSITMDPRSPQLPQFDSRGGGGRVGDLRLLQYLATCNTPPKPRATKATPKVTPTRQPHAATPATRPRAVPGPRRGPRRPIELAARAHGHVHAQRAPAFQRSKFDDLDLDYQRFRTEGDAVIVEDVVLRGVPIVGTVFASRVHYLGELLTLDNARLPKLGGAIRGDGVIRLGTVSNTIDRLRVRATDVELARLPLSGVKIAGRVSSDLTLRGPLDPARMTAEGWLCGNRVTVMGDAYADVGVWLGRAPAAVKACPTLQPPTSDAACLEVSKRGGRCLIARARRVAGGELIARVSAERDQRLGGDLSITAVPLAALATLAGSAWPAGAIFDADKLAVGGTLDAPTLAGRLKISRAWVLGGFLGDGGITFAPAGVGAVTLDGSFLDDRLLVRGRLGTTAPYRLDVTIDASRVPVDAFVDLAKLLGVPAARAAVSGRLRVRTALGDPRAPLDVTIELSELTASVTVAGFGGTPLPLDARLGAPFTASYDGKDLRILQPATIVTQLGTLAVVGAYGASRLDLSAHGTLDVARALPLADGLLDDARGSAELTVRVTGSAKAPRLKATLDVQDVAVRPARQEAWLRIPAGKIEIDDATGPAAGPGRRAVSFTGLSLEVDDGYSNDRASLGVAGGIVLEGATPIEWNVIIAGALGGEMLVLAAPGELASASGAADVNLRLFDKGARPRIDGTVTFDAARPLTLFPRSVRRELALSEGTIAVASAKGDPRQLVIDVDGLGGTIDGEGRLRNIRGTVEMIDFDLARSAADLTGSLEAYPYRVPRQLDLIVNVDGLRAVLDSGQLEIEGKVELVSGRYLVDFNLGEVLTPAPRGAPSTPPFWEASPLLANARLDLTVDARRLSVANNIANIDMEGALALTGTPRDPRLEGTILVQRGTFKIPGLRARFTRTTGALQFESLLPLGPTPKLDITSEADYRDPTGTDHLIIFRLERSLEEPHFDLYTASGLNKAQTLTLILSGRTPDEFRRNLGQAAIGTDPTRINPSTDTSQGYTDELFRQAAGDLLTRAVADTLRELSGLDVARIEFNLGSFGFHGEARVFENGRFVGDLERTTRGSTVNARLEYRVKTWASAETSYLSKNFDDAGERDISDFEAKLVLRTTWRAP